MGAGLGSAVSMGKGFSLAVEFGDKGVLGALGLAASSLG